MTGASGVPQTIHCVLVLGYGVTGRAVAAYCVRNGIAAFVSEAGELLDADRAWLQENGISFEECGNTDRGLADADAVVLSPGVSSEHSVVRTARARCTPVLSELEFAAHVAVRRTTIAVTGTNGKGSTVSLIAAMLGEADVRSCVCGNIGTPYIAVADHLNDVDVVVIEASSFQLAQCSTFRPDVAVLTNLSPDHIRRHGSMAAYREAKARLFHRQRPSDVAVFPEAWRDRFPEGAARRVTYDEATLDIRFHRWPEHERMNLMAALAACRAVAPRISASDLDPDFLLAALAEPFRMEVVGAIDGVLIINDSKSTNAASAVAALRAVDGSCVLLLGGYSKGAGYDALAREVLSSNLRAVVVFGAAATEFERLLAGDGVSLIRVDTVEQAIVAGLGRARPGDALLFSPACSSFDQYADYADRGRTFNRLIAERNGFSPRFQDTTR